MLKATATFSKHMEVSSVTLQIIAPTTGVPTCRNLQFLTESMLLQWGTHANPLAASDGGMGVQYNKAELLHSSVMLQQGMREVFSQRAAQGLDSLASPYFNECYGVVLPVSSSISLGF